jgi:pimeloyl-ACP methyl ester carboxylesterase
LEHSELMAEELPDAELQVISDANHMAMIDHYPVLNGALRRLFARALEASAAAVPG